MRFASFRIGSIRGPNRTKTGQIMRLTDTNIRSLTAPPKGAKVYYDDSLAGVGGRFGVRVSQGGTRAFILATGETRDRVTLGRYPVVSLADARHAAKTILAERQLGRHQPSKTTLKAALDLFAEQHLANLMPRTGKEIRRLFTRHLAKLDTKKLSEVVTQDITKITDKIAPSEAEHLHRACKTFFRWCVRRRMLQHSPLEGLELPSKWKPRERVLSDDELRAVWIAADATTGHFGIIVKLLLLTGQRRSEIGSLRAEWLDFGKSSNGRTAGLGPADDGSSPSYPASICLPGNITKNKRTHSFPLGGLSISIVAIAQLASQSGILFPARGDTPKPFNGWSKAKAQLDERVAEINSDKLTQTEAWTLHDLRRTYATNLQRLGIKLEVIEALLNHVSGTRAGIVGVYQRHAYEAEMRDAVEIYDAWFQHTIIGHPAEVLSTEPEWV
jgi:integrase